ncbi:MAG: MFS transporter [Acidobacteriota bacterium]
MSNLKTTVLLAAAMFLEAVGYGIVAPTLPFIALQLGANEFETGLVFGVYALVGVVLVIPLGLLADRFGRRILIYIGLGALAIGSLGFALAPGLGLLYVARMVQGIGGNAIWVGCLSMQGDMSSREGMGRSLSWLTAAWSFGFMLGPLLGAVGETYRTPYYIYAVVSALALVGSLTYLPESFRSSGSFTVGNFLRVFRLPNLWVSGSVVFLMAAFYGAFEAFVPRYLNDHGVPRSMMGVLFCGLAVPTIVLPPLIGKITDRLGDSRLLRFSLPVWTVIIGGSMYLMDLMHPMVAFVLLGAAEVFILMPSLAILHRWVPTEIRGSASSANNFMFSLGFTIGPILAGQAILSGASYHSVYVAIALFGIPVILFVYRMLRRLDEASSGKTAAGMGAVLDLP